MTILCVAEKPSVAKMVAEGLSNYPQVDVGCLWRPLATQERAV